ncbi:MAG TPA: hypothetical protein VGO40_02065 [Longimicrobium sp.]|jgi:hypothetical protein|nr:hypothetical protein [Longimicrobium sp.]
MGKLRLAIESLTVDSFATMPGEDAGGTVVAHRLPTVRTACGATCDDTCIRTCANTCLQTCKTCNATCLATCPASCIGTCSLTECGGCGIETQGPNTCRCTARC